MTQEMENLVDSCRVGFDAYVKHGELVLVDDRGGRHTARVKAWNNIPTVYVERTSDEKLEEVEPWMIHKIQKQP